MMRIKPKEKVIGAGLTATAVALLVIAVVAPAAGASEWKATKFPVSFLGEGLGLSTLQSEKNSLVVCRNSHTRGEVFSATLATVEITYLTGCELISESLLKFKEACPTITTKELAARPLSKLNGGIKTGLLVLARRGTETIATFTCSGSNKVKVEVTGSVICESTPIGKLVTQSKVIYKKKGNEAGVQEFASGEITQESRIVTAGLKAESTLSVFKPTEKNSLETIRDVIYSIEVEQTA